MIYPRFAAHLVAATVTCGILVSCGEPDSAQKTGDPTAESVPRSDPPPPPPAPEGSPLLSSASPFVRAFSGTPVHWRLWGDEAFALAKEHRRPIYLFIGYSACPWCVRMKDDVFGNPEIAAFLNEHFVPVVVDAEARPEINRSFMAFMQSSKGISGWPLNIFLTPEGSPLSGAGFMTSEGDSKNPSFMSAARHISSQWEQFPDHYSEQVKRDLKPLTTLYEKVSAKDLVRPTPELVTDTFSNLAIEFDPLSGGFSAQPKFLFAPRLEFLLHYASSEEVDPGHRSRALEMVETTLDRVAGAAVRDVLSGGFFRYATDTFWNGPNFEKHLIDQGVTAAAYTRGYESLEKPLYKDVVYETFRYIETEFASPDGTFYQSQATGADAGGMDRPVGYYYTWTGGEMAEALGPAGAVSAGKLFGLKSRGNLPSSGLLHAEARGRNVLIPPGSDAGDLAATKKKLLAFRNSRAAPDLDTSVHLAPNAYVALAYARAGRVFSDPALTAKGESVLAALRKSHCRGTAIPELGSRLGEIPGPPADTADFAAVVAAYLEMHRTTGQEQWLADAVAAQKIQDEKFYDPKARGYFANAADNHLYLSIKPVVDAAISSENSRSALNLITLAGLTGEADFRKRAWETLYGLTPFYAKKPNNSCTMIEALSVLLATGAAGE